MPLQLKALCLGKPTYKESRISWVQCAFSVFLFSLLLNCLTYRADLHALVEPHLYHLVLTPQHLAKPILRTASTHASTDNTHASQPHSSPTPLPHTSRSPYTTHILTLLVVSFPPLLFVIHLPIFPIREVCLIAGLAPFVLAHPYVRMVLPVLGGLLVDAAPALLGRWHRVRRRLVGMNLKVFGVDVAAGLGLHEQAVKGEEEEEGIEKVKEKMLPVSTILQRIIDDDRLSDECWNAEMREVQLWENERYGGVYIFYAFRFFSFYFFNMLLKVFSCRTIALRFAGDDRVFACWRREHVVWIPSSAEGLE